MDSPGKSEKTSLLPGAWVPAQKHLGTVYGSGSDESGESEIFHCSGQHGRAQSGLGVLLTSFFLVAQVAGLGVLALPWAISQTGWGGLGVLVAAGVGVGVAGVNLGTSWVILEERWPEYQRPCRKPYPAMAFRSLGKVGWHVVNVIQIVTLFGVSMVSILLSAELLASILEPLVPNLTVCAWLLICGVFFIPLSYLGSPRKFWIASVLALVATVAATAVVIAKILLESPSTYPQHPQPTLSTFFLGYGTIMFSYGGAITFPTIQNDMSDRSKFPLAILISFTVLLAMYLPLAGLGYLEFGSDVDVNVLLSVSGPSVTTVQALMLLNNIFTYVMLVNPLSQSLEEAANMSTEFGWKRCALRTTLVVLGVLISLAVQNFGRILNLIGSFAVPILTFILPPIFYIRLCDMEPNENENWSKRHLSLPHRIGLWFLVIVGSISGFVATWAAIQALLAPEEETYSCFNFY